MKTYIGGGEGEGLQHFKEIDWMPTVDPVLGILPSAFREKFSTTYATIDGSEVFIEAPSHLHMQSSTWSQYKHHNTAKFIVAYIEYNVIVHMN